MGVTWVKSFWRASYAIRMSHGLSDWGGGYHILSEQGWEGTRGR